MLYQLEIRREPVPELGKFVSFSRHPCQCGSTLILRYDFHMPIYDLHSRTHLWLVIHVKRSNCRLHFREIEAYAAPCASSVSYMNSPGCFDDPNRQRRCSQELKEDQNIISGQLSIHLLWHGERISISSSNSTANLEGFV